MIQIKITQFCWGLLCAKKKFEILLTILLEGSLCANKNYTILVGIPPTKKKVKRYCFGPTDLVHFFPMKSTGVGEPFWRGPFNRCSSVVLLNTSLALKFFTKSQCAYTGSGQALNFRFSGTMKVFEIFRILLAIPQRIPKEILREAIQNLRIQLYSPPSQ